MSKSLDKNLSVNQLYMDGTKLHLHKDEVLKWQNWDHFRSSGNDFYNLLNIVDGDEAIIDKLQNPRNAKILRQRSTFPTLTAKTPIL